MKNFQERAFEVKKLKRDIADLQTEIDYLEMRKGRMNNVLNNESRIIKNLGSLKRVIRQELVPDNK